MALQDGRATWRHGLRTLFRPGRRAIALLALGVLPAAAGGVLAAAAQQGAAPASGTAPATAAATGASGAGAAQQGGVQVNRAEYQSQSEYERAIKERIRQQFLQSGVDVFDATEFLEPLYEDMLAEWRSKGYKETQGVRIVIPATRFSAWGGTNKRPAVARGIGGDPRQALLWTEEESWLEYEVNIPESGLYNIKIDYYPLPGKRASIQRDLTIDGIYPFNEARRLLFLRTWRDNNLPKQDNQGNDVRPRQIEAPRWSEAYLEHPLGFSSEPLLFYLSAGRHRLRFRAVREPMAFSAIEIVSPQRLPTYAEVKRQYEAKGYKPAENVAIRVQAEFPAFKSDPTIRAEFDFDPKSQPPSAGLWRLNTFGDWRWRKAGQWAIWKFTVPQDGLYKIGFKAWQGYGSRMPTIREVRIDGKVPFAELREVQFKYDKYWRMDTLGDPKTGEPYLFYLTKGEHTLAMRALVGPISHTIRVLEDNIRELGKMSRQITMITGPDPDPNMDWEVYKKIPDLLPRIQKMAETFEQEAKRVFDYAGSRPQLGDQLLMTASQLRTMLRYKETIQNRLGEIGTIQSSLGYWVLELQNHPLKLDYFMVASPDVTFPNVRAPMMERLAESVDAFLASFYKNYTGVGSIYGGDSSEVVLEAWVARGREWAMIIKDLIEEDFTPATGVRVNVNVIPGDQMSILLLAASAGKAPDVAMGVQAGLPVEFAIRGGVLNLNEFPDYKEVASRFRPGALIPYKFRGGDYALPETQGFSMTFYRTDILGAFGLEAPETWEDVINMLPVLQQYGMNFYYPAQVGGFTPLLYQHGGEFYTPDGLQSALDTPEALAAFKLWTELYANYRVPIEASFYNRMRTGEMPIGVADYNTYIQLAVAAPELTGWWRMVPIPGVRKPDGHIDRSTGGYAETSVIFSSTKHPKEAWELIKWWTSEDIQARFGQELEALIGVEARWNTANVEALFNMPWPKRDIAAIAEQWRWFKEQPVVLGGYYTARHLNNAWNRVVLQGWNPREALEEAVKEIDRELKRKQEEFGIFVEQRRRRTLVVPQSQAPAQSSQPTSGQARGAQAR